MVKLQYVLSMLYLSYAVSVCYTFKSLIGLFISKLNLAGREREREIEREREREEKEREIMSLNSTCYEKYFHFDLFFYGEMNN